MVKNLSDNSGDIRDAGSIPGLGRCPGGGHGNPLQYSCLENPMDRGAWQATVHGIAKRHNWGDLASTHTAIGFLEGEWQSKNKESEHLCESCCIQILGDTRDHGFCGEEKKETRRNGGNFDWGNGHGRKEGKIVHLRDIFKSSLVLWD